MAEALWQPGDTIPKLFRCCVRTVPNRVAMRHKHLGIWEEYTWRDYWLAVARIWYGLDGLGLRRGDRVGILAEVSPEYFFADMAVQCAGALPVGFFIDGGPTELEHIYRLTDARFVICEDQEQADKILGILDRLPRIERVVVLDPRGMWDYDDPRLTTLEQLMQRGEAAMAQDPEQSRLVAAIGAGDTADPATIGFSSGTTGLPKAILIEYRTWLTFLTNLLAVDPVYPTDEYLVIAPPITPERLLSQVIPLVAYNTINFPERPDMDIVLANLREIHPTRLWQLSRVWENMANWIRIKVEDANWLKRTCYHIFLPYAYRRAELTFQGKPPRAMLRLLSWLGDQLVFRWVRARVGLSYMRSAFTAGAATGPDVIAFFHAIGVPLRQMYGQSECMIVTMHRLDDIRSESVGPPLPGVEMKIDDSGEILVRSQTQFREYLKEPAKTAETLRDGWLHSGDYGHFDAGGHLVIVDRQADLLKLPDGTVFSPQNVENRVKFSPYIREAVVVGSDLGFLSALIQIDLDTVGNWAQRRGVAYTTFRDLTTKEPVRQLIRRELDKTNERLPESLRLCEFVLLPKELDPDDGELTRSRKVKRKVVVEKYKDLWLPLYERAGKGEEETA